jgi:hypothetical protein
VSRELPPPQQDDEPPPQPEGSVRVTGPGPLVVLGLIGLVIGWGIRGQSIRSGAPTPTVSWLAVGVTWFVAAVVAGIAYLTWRTVHRDRRVLSPQQGVARLVLGKTIACLGAVAFGGFLGVSISYLGVNGESAQQAVVHALIATLGAGLGMAAGLLLEHACRVPPPAG